MKTCSTVICGWSSGVAFLEKTLKNKGMDSVRLYSLERLEPDEYHIFKANVIKNSLNRVDNYITLDEGTSAGIRPEMGVVDAKQVVGIVIRLLRITLPLFHC